MRREKFQQLDEQQQIEFLKQIVEERNAGFKADFKFSAYKHIDGDNDTSLSLSWEEPLGLFDETDCDYYQAKFGNLVESILFSVFALTDEENQPILVVHYFLYY